MNIYNDRERWECNRSKCQENICVRKGTWLEKCKLSYEKVILFIYSWCQEYSTTKFCLKEIDMKTEAITNWKNYLREVLKFF